MNYPNLVARYEKKAAEWREFGVPQMAAMSQQLADKLRTDGQPLSEYLLSQEEWKAFSAEWDKALYYDGGPKAIPGEATLHNITVRVIP